MSQPASQSETPPAPAGPTRQGSRTGYAWAVLATAVASAAGWPLYHGFNWPHEGRSPRLDNANVLMFYLLGVLLVATRHGRGPATLASVLGVAVFDFCFVPPYLRFTVHDPQYLVTFAVMLLTALTIGTLTHRVRQQADAARDRERRTQTLLALSRDLAAARTRAEIVDATVRHAGAVAGAPAVLQLRGDEATRDGDVCGDNGDGGREPGVYFPAHASRGPVGVLGIVDRPHAGTGPGVGGGLRPEQRQLLAAFASQAALAVERAALAEEANAAWERVEAEFVRNTLLSGVSHDLRTPLAAITGAVTSLTEAGDRLTPAARAEMLETIRDEAERMERLVNNLLDMTRLESGGLVLRREWQPVQEVVGSALRHLDRRLTGRAVRVNLPDDLPLVEIDAVAVEQVLVNLIDNAVDHAPADSPVNVSVRAADGGGVVVEVADRGPGLPPGAEGRVFDKFFRAAHPGVPSRPGVGLGLAICRGLVEAHGGTIAAENRPGGGAVFRFTLPRAGTPPVLDSTG